MCTNDGFVHNNKGKHVRLEDEEDDGRDEKNKNFVYIYSVGVKNFIAKDLQEIMGKDGSVCSKMTCAKDRKSEIKRKKERNRHAYYKISNHVRNHTRNYGGAAT